MAPPHTVFATPTTRLSIGDLANCTYRPEKCIAIVAEARALSSGGTGQILLRTTARTTAETISLVRDFWLKLSLNPSFEQEG
jgi:3-hydroxybutyryl-CoA dehydrogenase